MLTDLGRGPLEFRAIEIATALTEAVVDLPQGSRGFFIKSRQVGAARKIRISNVKGAVSSSDDDAKYWTLDSSGTRAEVGMFVGLRIMSADAEDGQGNAISAQPADTVLEQRLYVTAEVDDTTIEIVIMPGF